MAWWQRQFGKTTRGRIVALLRRGERSVEELATALDLTDNAVRAQLTQLEHDGVVRVVGTRRDGTVGKPATLYGVGRRARDNREVAEGRRRAQARAASEGAPPRANSAYAVYDQPRTSRTSRVKGEVKVPPKAVTPSQKACESGSAPGAWPTDERAAPACARACRRSRTSRPGGLGKAAAGRVGAAAAAAAATSWRNSARQRGRASTSPAQAMTSSRGASGAAA